MARFSKIKVRNAIHQSANAVIRMASTAAFRAKVLWKRVEEVRAVPLHKLIDQPLRREVIRQNAFLTHVFALHLPPKKRQEMLRRLNKSTLVTSSLQGHNFQIGAISLAGALPLLGAAIHYENAPLSTSSIFLSGYAFSRLLAARTGVMPAGKFIVEKGEVKTLGTLRTRAVRHIIDKSTKVKTKDRALLANAIVNVYKFHNSRTIQKTMLPENWQAEPNPSLKGMVLGRTLANLQYLPGGGRLRAWTMLNAIQRGRITPEQAYEISHRHLMRFEKKIKIAEEQHKRELLAEAALQNFEPPKKGRLN